MKKQKEKIDWTSLYLYCRLISYIMVYWLLMKLWRTDIINDPTFVNIFPIGLAVLTELVDHIAKPIRDLNKKLSNE